VIKFWEAIASIDAFTWLTGAGALHVFIAAPTSMHVLLNKDYEHAAVSWIGLIIFPPFLGSAFYWLFGINRIKRHG
jgi:cardiolipin synthase